MQEYYFPYLSNTSFIHLNPEYFQEDPALGKVSDMHLFVMAFIRLCTIVFLICLITILTFCILATSLTSLVVVLDNVDYQIGIIRNADIFNPAPTTITPAPLESVSSDPKLAPQPPPSSSMEERSLSSITYNNTDEEDFCCDGEIIHRLHDFCVMEMEMDETQSLTSISSTFDSSNSK
uniref:Uncharacterized protein n=1 Tax=Panagrolaimus sp. ES5 TaxID=591445 RepID=A0AC34GUP1_9BILA